MLLRQIEVARDVECPLEAFDRVAGFALSVEDTRLQIEGVGFEPMVSRPLGRDQGLFDRVRGRGKIAQVLMRAPQDQQTLEQSSVVIE